MGKLNGRYTTGAYTTEVLALRRHFAELIEQAREAMRVMQP
jgi:hypothetical protein